MHKMKGEIKKEEKRGKEEGKKGEKIENNH